MITNITLKPGVTLYCYTDNRFKQGCLSLQFLRPMRRNEAGLNALIPSILLRGSQETPDLREITRRLDDLYGGSIGPLVRQIGDYQTTGVYCSFIADRFAMEGDEILRPMLSFLEELLLRPATQAGSFRQDYVESEKRNLILALEAQKNDRRGYATSQLVKYMCKGDAYGESRLGEIQDIASTTSREIYAHYEKILQESPVQFFYVGACDPRELAELLKPLCEKIGNHPQPLPDQRAFTQPPRGSHTEKMDITQGRICLGFVSPVTIREEAFASMQVLNSIFGGGMTSKLFMNVREKRSLCYDIGSGYRSSKGIMVVSAGVDKDKISVAREEILKELKACQNGEITTQELESAKLALISSLQGLHDSPGGIEDYYSTVLLSQSDLMPDAYLKAVEAVTVEQVVAAAKTLQLHTEYYLRGE